MQQQILACRPYVLRCIQKSMPEVQRLIFGPMHLLLSPDAPVCICHLSGWHAPPQPTANTHFTQLWPPATFHLLQYFRHLMYCNTLQKRFVLDESASSPRIRAAQGHSVQLQAPVLTPVTDASSVPCAVHATSKEG